MITILLTILNVVILIAGIALSYIGYRLAKGLTRGAIDDWNRR